MDLEAIKARCEAATEGPWEFADVAREVWVSGGNIDVVSGEDGAYISDADGEFIAHAREDVPALVAEVERLQKQLAVAVKDLSEYPDRCLFCKSHVDSEECANSECEAGEQWEWRGPQEGETENA